LVDDWMIGRDLAVGRLARLFPDHHCAAGNFVTSAGALCPSRAWLSRKVRVMIDVLRALLQRAA
jgi:DNA-binding transcriptional LysR family regulator